MLLVKPQVLGLSFRPMEYRKRFGLCVSGYLHVPFAQGPRGSLWGEQSMWNFLASEMEVPLIDEGISKLTSEFLVHGNAYPNADHRNAVAVRARLGSVEKTVLAFGDRHWNGKSPSEPASFERMPLNWRNAYGGASYPDNPVGTGRAVSGGVQRLPNLELPASRMVQPGQDIVPAGFGPLEVTHPQRAALRGTYDETWFKEHSPGFAPDLGWKHFNVAPSDQWFDTPLRGDEPFSLENLHPQRRLIEGRLPGMRVRVFARRRVAGEPGQDAKLRELSMRLSTVWFFPHAERMVLVFHGVAETTEDDGSDIGLLLGAVERLEESETRQDPHYLAAIDKRTVGPNAELHWLSDTDLIPPGLDTADPTLEAMQSTLRPDGLKEDAAFRKAGIDLLAARNLVRLRGKDPDALGLTMPVREKPPTMDELPAVIEKAQKDAQTQQWAAIERAVTQIEQAKKLVADGTLDPEQLVHRGPPKLQMVEQLAQLEQAHVNAAKPFDRADTLQKLLQAEASQKAGYLQSAHMQQPARRLQDEAREKSRKEIEFLLAHGVKRWSGLDFTGADLSNLDLRGIDLSGAWLESANLQNSNLTRANLHAAVIAHADLRGAIAVGADFSGANLGAANLEDALLDRSDFSCATLMRTSFKRTDLRSTKLDFANLLESRWADSDCSAANGTGVHFHQLDLKGTAFRDAQLAGCAFIECDLTGADFCGANLRGASFVGCNAETARFAGAQMAGAVFVTGTVLKRADFSDADLSGANFGECDASGARFVRAVLDGANLCACTLVECDMRDLSAKAALMRKASLSRSRLAGANLKDAILQKADLRGTDLRNTHLFGADLSRARLDGDVRLDGAVLERARIYPRLPATPP